MTRESARQELEVTTSLREVLSKIGPTLGAATESRMKQYLILPYFGCVPNVRPNDFRGYDPEDEAIGCSELDALVRSGSIRRVNEKFVAIQTPKYRTDLVNVDGFERNREYLGSLMGLLVNLNQLSFGGYFTHLDLHPNNLAFTFSNKPAITDFGRSHYVSDTEDLRGKFKRRLIFMSTLSEKLTNPEDPEYPLRFWSQFPTSDPRQNSKSFSQFTVELDYLFYRIQKDRVPTSPIRWYGPRTRVIELIDAFYYDHERLRRIANHVLRFNDFFALFKIFKDAIRSRDLRSFEASYQRIDSEACLREAAALAQKYAPRVWRSQGLAVVAA